MRKPTILGYSVGFAPALPTLHKTIFSGSHAPAWEPIPFAPASRFWFPRAGVGTNSVCSCVPFLWACGPATLARRECVPTPARSSLYTSQNDRNCGNCRAPKASLLHRSWVIWWIRCRFRSPTQYPYISIA
jgi:hypothetical protein